MSAQPCGCDPQEHYVCRVHTEALEKAVDAFVAPEYEDAADVEEMMPFNPAPISMNEVMQTREYKDALAAGRKALLESGVAQAILNAPIRQTVDDILDASRAFNLEQSRQLDAYGNVYQRNLDSFNRAAREGVAQLVIQQQQELQRIAAILATFYRAPLSMSSVQPLLDLAVELNPSLKETK